MKCPNLTPDELRRVAAGVRDCIQACGSASAAARELGVSRTALTKRHGIYIARRVARYQGVTVAELLALPVELTPEQERAVRDAVAVCRGEGISGDRRVTGSDAAHALLCVFGLNRTDVAPAGAQEGK